MFLGLNDRNINLFVVGTNRSGNGHAIIELSGEDLPDDFVHEAGAPLEAHIQITRIVRANGLESQVTEITKLSAR
jgi:hypothetical protein